MKSVSTETLVPLLALMFMQMNVVITSHCGSTAQTMYSAENRALMTKHTYETKFSPNRVRCGRDCSVDKRCKSFNYAKASAVCELNNSTRSEHPGYFTEHQNSMYFDHDVATSLFSLPMARYSSCSMMLDAGYYKTSGVYTIYPDGFSGGPLRVYCDLESDGGGWIVVQRRQDGSVDFYQDWAQYKFGFGDMSGELWLGNDNLLKLTSSSGGDDLTWELRMELQDRDGNSAFAKYTDFKISGENYTLDIGEYDVRSTAGDSFGYHRGRPFSTKDNDNDDSELVNCAQDRKGAWWFGSCLHSHFNGEHIGVGQESTVGLYQVKKGIVWYNWLEQCAPVQKCTMKIRQKFF